jgi:hypothetical protein
MLTKMKEDTTKTKITFGFPETQRMSLPVNNVTNI